MKTTLISTIIPTHLNPVPYVRSVTNRNSSDTARILPATKRNIMDIHPVIPYVRDNILNILSATVCNKKEPERTKPSRMSKHLNHKALKMNVTPQPPKFFFTTHSKTATKHNKGELKRTKQTIMYILKSTHPGSDKKTGQKKELKRTKMQITKKWSKNGTKKNLIPTTYDLRL